MAQNGAETKYFKLDGGSTVIQRAPEGWSRWDIHDGLVSTQLWAEDDERLTRITFDEALELIK